MANGHPGFSDVVNVANMIYGENASEDYDTMVMTGSTVYNRLKETKENFGNNVMEVLDKPNAYYAVTNNTPLYQQGTRNEFPDKKSESKYKKSLQIAYGLHTGTIPKVEGQFFFKKGEAKGLRKKLKFLKKTGIYDVYTHK